MKRVIATNQAPAAIGPYSQAVEAGNLLFVSGQLGLDPATGDFVPGGVPPPESLPFEQPVKTSDAAKSKMPAAVIGTFFKRALPSPPPIQMYRVRFYFVHHKPPIKTFAGCTSSDVEHFRYSMIIITYFIAFHNVSNY